MMAERPHLYPYFYEKKPLADGCDPSLRVEILRCCEMIANHCDNTALQRENIPDHVWRRWRNSIRGQIDRSVALQHFMRQCRSSYSPEVGEILDEAAARRRSQEWGEAGPRAGLASARFMGICTSMGAR